MNQHGSRQRTVALVVVAVVASVVLLGGFAFAVFRYVGSDDDDGVASGVASAAENTATPTVRVNSAPSPDAAGEVPNVQAPTSLSPRPVPASDVPAQPARGDLGLDVPITVPLCDNSGIVVIHSAVDPASYTQEVSSALSANPGSSYLRTDNSCPSLRQQSDGGNPIYAVYRPAGWTTQSICAAVAEAPLGSYGKWLDRTSDPTIIVPC